MFCVCSIGHDCVVSDLIGDLVGGAIGTLLGEGLRGLIARRAERRSRDGQSVKIRAHAEVDGLPDYRSLRGFLVRREGRVTWRPLLVSRLTHFNPFPPSSWESGPFDLSAARCVGSHRELPSEPASREVFQLVGVPPLASVSVTPRFAVTARILLPSSYGASSH